MPCEEKSKAPVWEKTRHLREAQLRLGLSSLGAPLSSPICLGGLSFGKSSGTSALLLLSLPSPSPQPGDVPW